MNRDDVLSIFWPWPATALGILSVAILAGYLARSRKAGESDIGPKDGKIPPRASADATPPGTAPGGAGEPAFHSNRKPAPRLDGISMLLADDDALVREMVRNIFMREGAGVETVAGAREALEQLQSRQRKFDIALLDLQMQDMDGLTLTRLIRGMPHLHAMPVLAFTASIPDFQRDEATAAGMDGIILKPFETKPTVALILRALEKRRANSGTPVSGYLPRSGSELPVLDAKRGLAYWSDRDVYVACLKRFVRDHADTPQAVAGLDAAALAELARDVRRASRLLGMAALAAAASELESALQGNAVTASVLQGFAQAIETACRAASSHVEECAGPAVKSKPIHTA